MCSHEVEDRTERLVLGLAQPAAELLEEQRRTLRRAEHEHGVDSRHVDTLVEQVDGEHHVHVAGRQLAQCLLPFRCRRLTRDRNRRNAVAGEVTRHEVRVLDTDAEPETPHRGNLDVLVDLLHHESSPSVGTRVRLTERSNVVPGAASPRNGPEVEAVVNAVVDEGRQVLLLDRIPQPQLGGNAVTKPVQHGQAVTALRRGRQAQQLPRFKMRKDTRVRRCSRMMELVDDHHIEMISGQRGEVIRVQTLDRRKHMLEARRPRPTNPLLAERRVAQRVAEGRQTLVEDLLAMRDEQQP